MTKCYSPVSITKEGFNTPTNFPSRSKKFKSGYQIPFLKQMQITNTIYLLKSGYKCFPYLKKTPLMLTVINKMSKRIQSKEATAVLKLVGSYHIIPKK